MLMPSLVRRTDSQVEMCNVVVSQLPYRIDDLWRVSEQMCAAFVAVEHEPTRSDLYV